MKRLWTICTACLLCLSLQAVITHKRVVEYPAFVTANTSEIEIRKITLTDEQTQVDAVFYGQPGTPAVLSSKTYLQTSQFRCPLREADKVSIDGLTEPEVIPESGRLNVILSFAPVPEGVHEVDFVEMESGWNIWGIQLTEADPYVYIPNFLTDREESGEQLPEPQLKLGQARVNGYVLGYDTRMLMDMRLNYGDGVFPEDWQLPVRVRQDGSFHVELDLVKACKARLKVNQAELPLFLLPGGELTVYIHLPALSMSASRLQRHRHDGQPVAWFDGAGESLDEQMASALVHHGRHKSDETWQQYADSWDQCLTPDEVKADLQAARSLCSRIQQRLPLEANDRKVLASLRTLPVRAYLQAREAALRVELSRAEAEKEAVVAVLDTTVTGADILPRIIAPHKGRAVLIDFWATWCGPCKRSVVAMRPLKERLASKEVVYIYLTGPTSPVANWRQEMGKMKGVHYRLSEAQWKYLCQTYGVTGIPAYLVISYDGKLQGRYVGFPGVDVLERDLLRASGE